MRGAVAIAALCLAASPALAETRSYKGLNFRQLPDGCRQRNATVLDWRGDMEPIGTLTVSCSGVLMEWLTLETGGESTRSWEVKDVIRYPKIPDGFDLTHANCELDGRIGHSIIAIAKWKPEKSGAVATDIRYAWAANSDKLRFDRLPVKRVSCRSHE